MNITKDEERVLLSTTISIMQRVEDFDTSKVEDILIDFRNKGYLTYQERVTVTNEDNEKITSEFCINEIACCKCCIINPLSRTKKIVSIKPANIVINIGKTMRNVIFLAMSDDFIRRNEAITNIITVVALCIIVSEAICISVSEMMALVLLSLWNVYQENCETGKKNNKKESKKQNIKEVEIDRGLRYLNAMLEEHGRPALSMSEYNEELKKLKEIRSISFSSNRSVKLKERVIGRQLLEKLK